jgi:hypothetical protein
MPSDALVGLLSGIGEVRDLQRANPTPPGGMPARPPVVRAINRSSVVLLTSHLERYLHALNEEALTYVNVHVIDGPGVPEGIRLQHSRVSVDRMFETQWDNRSAQLVDFSQRDSWLWGPSPKGDLDADRLLTWMKSPSPERIERLFAMWGVTNIFDRVTRQPHTKARMRLKIGELVGKRHNIAHGDFTTEATYRDIATYMSVVRQFCKRADAVMSRVVSRGLDIDLPW